MLFNLYATLLQPVLSFRKWPFTCSTGARVSNGKMSLLMHICWCFLAFSALVAAATDDNACNSFRQKCLAFMPAKLIQTSTLTRREFVPAGTTLQLSDNVPSCNRPSQAVTVDLCRIALQIPTSKRSSISFELWLPRQWEGARYLATGNGGIDGCECFFVREPESQVKLTMAFRHQVRGSRVRHQPWLRYYGYQQRT